MLTTIGDKIVEIRPKQVIESSTKLDNTYLTPLNKRSDPNYKVEPKKITHEKYPKRPPANTQASS